MHGQGASQGQVFLRRDWAEDGVGELAVALLATRRDLRVEAAAAGLWVAQRGHALCIAVRVPPPKGCAYRSPRPEVPAWLSTPQEAVIHRLVHSRLLAQAHKSRRRKASTAPPSTTAT